MLAFREECGEREALSHRRARPFDVSISSRRVSTLFNAGTILSRKMAFCGAELSFNLFIALMDGSGGRR